MTKIDNIGVLKLLPYFLQSNKDIQIITQIVQEELDLINKKETNLFTYGDFNSLEEVVLDELGYQWKAEGYEQTLDKNTKAKLVETAYVVIKTKGTKASLEKVVSDIYGAAKISEWFEYGGDPHHFKIKVNDVSIDKEKIVELNSSVENSKRESSTLEATNFKYENTAGIKVHTGASSIIFETVGLETGGTLAIGDEYGLINKAVTVDSSNSYIPYYNGIYRVIDGDSVSTLHKIGNSESKLTKYRGRAILDDSILRPATVEMI